MMVLRDECPGGYVCADDETMTPEQPVHHRPQRDRHPPHRDMKIGTVSAKIAPRLKCYKNASRLNHYNFPTDNAIDFLFSILHTTPFHYEVLKIGSQ